MLTDGEYTVRWVSTQMAGEQLGYTYTPTEQKRVTTPNPARMLARRATEGSVMEILLVGRLYGYKDMVVLA